MIKVKAMDDFGVARVHVALTNQQTGAVIENENAVETRRWVRGVGLRCHNQVSAGTNVHFDVVATDFPGGTALDTFIKAV